MDFTQYTWIIRPLIGAGIGYVTNWIAVKMLFRPLYPKKIGKVKIPFTPGLIPKNQPRLAEAVGNTVSKDLLSEEDLKKTLLSDEMKQIIREKIVDALNNLTENETTMEQLIKRYIGDAPYGVASTTIADTLSTSISEKLTEANLGNVLSEQLKIVANDKLKGSLIGVFGGGSLIDKISSEAESKINSYIDENSKEYVNDMITKELSNYSNKTVGDLFIKLGNVDVNIVDMIEKIYEDIIIEKLPSLLRTINISKIVTDKINDMDPKELEKLVLKIMKKELNSLVSLGALIGFILGLLNLLF